MRVRRAYTHTAYTAVMPSVRVYAMYSASGRILLACGSVSERGRFSNERKAVAPSFADRGKKKNERQSRAALYRIPRERRSAGDDDGPTAQMALRVSPGRRSLLARNVLLINDFFFFYPHYFVWNCPGHNIMTPISIANK